MGCDGGTIPKRNEIVKNKQKEQTTDKRTELTAKWQFCALSGLRLKQPIVACQLGFLYNKDAIIEYLLSTKTSSGSVSSTCSNKPSVVSHIRSLKDVKELNLKSKDDSDHYETSEPTATGSENLPAQFVCPTSGLHMNGKYKFYYLLSCGCVISDRALKQVPNESTCIVCSKTYDPSLDLIVINGNQEELIELKKRLVERRQLRRGTKKINPSQPSSSGLGSKPTTSIKSKHSGTREETIKRMKVETKVS